MIPTFKVNTAVIGTMKGAHVPYVRPDLVAASDTDINRLFKSTRGFNGINALSVSQSNVVGPMTDASVEARIKNSKWKFDRSIGIIILDLERGQGVERYMLSFYVDKDAVKNGQIDDRAVLFFNTSTKVIIGKNRLKRAQTDIIQRLAGGSDAILPNRVSDRLECTANSDGINTHIGDAGRVLNSKSNLGDSSTLLAEDSFATTLYAMGQSTKTLGKRSFGIGGGDVETTVCEGAVAYAEETQRKSNDLLSFILNERTGSVSEFSISIGELKRTIHNFDFEISERDFGNIDFTKTAQLNTVNGAQMQFLANQILGLMQSYTIASIKFGASNEDGSIDMVTGNGWIQPFRVTDVDGIDTQMYDDEHASSADTIHSVIKRLILPKVMVRPDTTVIVNIELLTASTLELTIGSTKDTINLQNSALSAWSTINTSDTQTGPAGLARKKILNSIIDNFKNQDNKFSKEN